MTGTEAEISATAATTLRETPQPDDAGAATADRFDWQAAMATADALAAYLMALGDPGTPPTTDFELICELHEDWALTQGPHAEIVSAKHKESSFGAFTTLRSLLVEGGLLHLYRRWAALARTPRCRLVTTAGLHGPPRDLVEASIELQRVGTLEYPTHVDVVAAFLDLVDDGLTDDETSPTLDDVTQFLLVLRVDDSKPRRDHVHLLAPNGFALPVANRLGHPAAAQAIWEAALEIVRERMRAAGPTPRAALPRVLGARDEDGHVRRTVTFGELHAVISVAIQNADAYRALPEFAPATRVALKMQQGGCSGNAIQRAEALRLQYRSYWRGRLAAPGAMAERESLLNRLRRIADQETDAATAAATPGEWGSDLWRRLDQRTEELASGPDSNGLNADLLLGGASDLANRCEIWFSERFDLDAAQGASGNGRGR